jgi:methyl-accepting chemotaxis protein
MSIRIKILLPMILLALSGLAQAGFEMWLGAAENAKLNQVAVSAIQAGEAARRANEDFDRLAELLGEVTAMTHFMEPDAIKQRFETGVVSVTEQLKHLRAAALSPKMSETCDAAGAIFALWRAQAAVTLGVERAAELPVADDIRWKSETVKSTLGQAVALAGADARVRLDEIAIEQTSTMRVALGLSGVLAVAILFAAMRFANSLTRPIQALVASADRLARGDVSVTFAATDRRDEIGDIARAVAAFRDNVAAAQGAESQAARERMEAEAERRRSETQRVSSSAEQARVVDALSEGLERLASGDLTYRVAADFGADYARLKTNFNKSLDALSHALGLIGEGARDLRSGSADIADLAADLSSRTGSQTASIEEAAASLEEITATVQKTAGNAAQARGVVARTRDEAEKSGAVVRTAVEAIARIQQSSQEIEKIIGVIDEIAFQTSLLALNAGVEAARAGETGRGFAVVATEVRGLAQRSADASKEIKGLISKSSTQVKEGVDLVVSAGAALDRIFAQVSEIDHTVDAIASAASEQANGVQSVNNGVSAIDRMNQTNADVVERTTSACASVAERAEQLVEAVAKFQIVRQGVQLRRAA